MHYLRRAWNLWKRLGRFIGDLTGRAVLTVFYFTIFVPFGIAMRGFSDPLRLKHSHCTSFWITQDTQNQMLEDAGREF
jgi:hypothetical protein